MVTTHESPDTPGGPLPGADAEPPDGIGPRLTARLDERLNRAGLRTPFARDLLTAAAVAVLSVGMLLLTLLILARAEDIRLPVPATAVLILLVGAQSAVLCVRRRNPVACLSIVAGLQLAALPFFPAGVNFQGLAPFVAAYTCGTLLPARARIRLLAAVTVLHGLVGAVVAGAFVTSVGAVDLGFPVGSGDDPLLRFLEATVWAVLVYGGSALVGIHVGTRRRYLELLRVRADEAIRAQRERAENAIRAERTNMARELHDIAAHHLSGMVVQAGAVERLIGRDDRAAREATAWIRARGRETLDGLRLVARTLRDPGWDTEYPGAGPGGGDGPVPLGAPMPGVAALDALVRAERELGIIVELVREGDPYPLPPVADVTVHHVARQALSNAREHAPGAPVRILLRHEAGRVVLEVDNGPGRVGEGDAPAGEGAEPGNAPRGMGLIGMGERAHLVNGRLMAGPTPSGGWRVRLEIPVDRERAPVRDTPGGTGHDTDDVEKRNGR
ncbi:sensor histidine kinase [Streptomyces sp. ST2-7A]|uniref:sensor histidine kinase n=1 Tax=Streptomyces sp. ST2-7A TaxID=2907214 RepID=UPI001F200B16|nr:histidine kinase [Streptomyces sp. ST2-7A]MCE7082076.1 histidine kinase [Streptomyces sp. ST2-7A]